MKRPTEEYAMIGWLIFMVVGFVTDYVLIWNETCLSEFFGFEKTWWAECKTLAAVRVAHASPVNLSDFGVILSFAVIGLVLGVIYGKVKNKNSKVI